MVVGAPVWQRGIALHAATSNVAHLRTHSPLLARSHVFALQGAPAATEHDEQTPADRKHPMLHEPLYSVKDFSVATAVV